MPKVIYQVVYNCFYCMHSEVDPDSSDLCCMFDTMKTFGDKIDIDFNKLDDEGKLKEDTELFPDWCPLPDVAGWSIGSSQVS